MECTDDMANDWGSDLVKASGSCEKKAYKDLGEAVLKSVSGFRLVCINPRGGDYANQDALELALRDCLDFTTCLFGLGINAGNGKILPRYTSTEVMWNSALSLPLSPDIAPAATLAQTVPLPYYVPCSSVNDKSIMEYEDRCFLSIHKKLLVAELIGAPFKVIMLELILRGNGGILSHRFLARLGSMLKGHGVRIIVDEVLTGGRVGPTMTLTQSAPSEFLDQVEFITMGRFLACGIVLRKVPSKAHNDGDQLQTVIPWIMQKQEEDESAVGKALEHRRDVETGEAWARWKRVQDELEGGNVEQRRLDVLRRLGVAEEDHWGRGCLIFTARFHQEVSAIHGFGNRILPMLEELPPAPRGRASPSPYTKSWVCEKLMKAAQDWIDRLENDRMHNQVFENAFVDLILEDSTDLLLTIEECVDRIGHGHADKLAQLERGSHNEDPAKGTSIKGTTTYVRQVLLQGMRNLPSIVKRVRKTSRRTTTFNIQRGKVFFYQKTHHKLGNSHEVNLKSVLLPKRI